MSLRDAVGAQIVARAAALAERVERARGHPRLQRADVDEALAGAQAEIAELQASVAELATLRSSIDAFATQLADVQAMAASAYEATLDWPAQLVAVREAPDYDRPWEEDEPLVTVRIATYDNARILCERTLPSVIAQTYGNWEAVVVGDAVNDDTEARIAALGDERIRFLNLPFRGPYPEADRARWLIAGTAPANRGLEEARGAWIASLDHDDAFTPDHIGALLAEARRTRAEVVYGRLAFLDAADELLLTTIGEWPPRLGQFAWQAAIYHRGLTRFRFDERARFAGEPGDWNLARRLWEAGARFAFLDHVVGDYHYEPRDAAGRAHLAGLRERAVTRRR